VPDIYQGDELLCLSLVDPDNRRPVDWDERSAALDAPPPKLDLILHALALRKRLPEAFAGAYEPVAAGPDTIAFTRGGAVFVAVRLRGDAELPRPEGDWAVEFELDGLLLLTRQ
jgi:(1->4)-alpha-D-glucan 1-alpha-D-glucosylmutase